MECLSGRIHAIDSDPVLESSRARQMWLQIVCDGKIAAMEVKLNHVYRRDKHHGKVKIISLHGKRQRHVEKIKQTCKTEFINSAMQIRSGCDARSCNDGKVRLRLRHKCAERFMYVDKLTGGQSAFYVRQR